METIHICKMANQGFCTFERENGICINENNCTNKILTKQEAITLMKQGRKITHSYFDKNEYMTIEESNIILEDGVQCSEEEFWNYRRGPVWETGYSLY